MSNTYYNELSFNGDTAEVALVKEMIMKDGEVDFAIVTPPPKDIADADRYNWAKYNWGTPRSGLYARVEKDDPQNFAVSFSTFLAHPSDWFADLCSKIERQALESIEMTLSYAEGGEMFGACKDFNCEIGICYSEMSGSEIIEFLSIEECD